MVKSDEISILKLFNSLYFPGSMSRYNKSWPWLIFLLFQPTLYTTTIPSTILLILGGAKNEKLEHLGHLELFSPFLFSTESLLQEKYSR